MKPHKCPISWDIYMDVSRMFFSDLAPFSQRQRVAMDWSSSSRPIFINLQPTSCGSLIKAEPLCISSHLFLFFSHETSAGASFHIPTPHTYTHLPSPLPANCFDRWGANRWWAKQITNQQKWKAFPHSSPVSVFEPRGESAICIQGGRQQWAVGNWQRIASHNRFQRGLIRTPSGRGGASWNKSRGNQSQLAWRNHQGQPLVSRENGRWGVFTFPFANVNLN